MPTYSAEGTGLTGLFTLKNDGTQVVNITEDGDYVGRLLGNLPTVSVGSSLADYITDGTADDVQIQAALDDLSTAGGGTCLLKTGTFNTTSTITIPSNVCIRGMSKAGTIVKMGASQNKTVFTNSDTTNGNSNIVLSTFTIDQNGSNQTSAGGGFSGQYVTDLLVQDMIFKTSYNFNFFLSAHAGTVQTGTVTLTSGSNVLTGSGTTFTTQLSIGTIIKSAGGEFARITKIVSNTSALMEYKWGFSTESGVAWRVINPNARNKFINNVFEGSLNTDNVGFGIFVDGLFQGNVSRNSGGGYGFGPDHCFDTVFISNSAYGNDNHGFGVETCVKCVFIANTCRDNDTGITLLSGSRDCVVSSNICKDSTHGVQVKYNSTSFPLPDGNVITDNICEDNTSHGIRYAAGSNGTIRGNRCVNNGLGGATTGGITLVTENSVAPNENIITNNVCHDTQTTKTQSYGIWVAGGTNNYIADNYSPIAGNLTGGILDSGTNNTLRNNLGVNRLGFYDNGNVTGATTINRLNGDVQYATLTGNITVTLTVGRALGDRMTLILIQDATGGRTATWPAVFKKAGGSLTLSVGANAIDQINLVWDGSYWVEVSRALNCS